MRNKETQRQLKYEWIERNPEKRAAHIKLNAALRSGVIVRQDCAVCGEPKTHAHHDDYTKPLDVKWLCPKHHKEAHGITGRRPRPEPWTWTKKLLQKDDVLKLRAEGLSFMQIATKLGMSKGHAFKIATSPNYR